MKVIKKTMSVSLATLMLMGLNAPYVYAENTKVDIVFLMDTSGSMGDEATSLVSAMNSVASDLSVEFDLDTKLWGITGTGWGLTSSLRAEVPGALSNHSEDWGPAVDDISKLYTGWRPGAVKIAVPVSDECPENGDGCYQDDEDIANTARNAADAASVHVLPIMGTGASTTVKQLANIIATDNKILDTTSGSYSVEEMKNAIKEIVATVTGDIVLPPTLGNYYIQGGYIQVPISKAPGAKGIEWEVSENGTFINGQSTTSIDKISIAVPDTQTHEYVVKARSFGVDSAGFTIYSDYTETTAKYIGNFADLISECSVAPSLPQCFTTKNLIQEETGAENPAVPETKIETKIGEVSDPVDITTGNFSFSNTDIYIKTAGIPLVVKRTYNSLDIQRGWGFNIVNSMDTADLNNIKVTWGSGQTETFTKTESGWSSKYGTSVLYTESGFYTVELTDKTKFRFTLNGRLQEVINKKGLGYKYEYVGNDINVYDVFDNLLLSILRDNNLQVTKLEDASGNSSEYTYLGTNLTAYKNRNGDTETYEYDINGVVSRIVGADGSAYVENTYDGSGRVLTQKDGAGQLTQFSYDLDNTTYIITKTTVTYPDGTAQDYNVEYNRVKSTSLDSSNISYEYDANGKISKLTDQNGKSWTFERNGDGQLTVYTDPLNNTYKYSYDTAGNLLQTTDPEGKQVSFEYDANRNLLKITYPDTSTKSFEYDVNNQLIKSTNQLSNEINYTYDANGFIAALTLPNTGEMKYLYTALGQVSSVEDPLGNKVTYAYDAEGKLTQRTDALGNTVSYAYNTYGDLVEVTDARGGKTTYEYNTDGLRTKVSYPDSSTMEYKYDALGRLIESKDKLGRISKQEYDTFGRLAKVITPQGKYISYQYDAVGNLTKTIDENGNELSSEFNDIGQSTKKYDALSNLLTEKEYSAIGLPKTIADGLGKNVKFQYDNLNRLSSATLSDMITASASYDALGQITAVTDPKGYQTVYEYDELGNPIKETNPLGKSTEYSYDLYGRVTGVVDPNQIQLSYQYDAVGNISALSFKKGGSEETIEYDYDAAYNPVSIKDALGEIKYDYDAANRITKRTDVFGNSLGYAYDEIGRLISITYPDNKLVSYEYDQDDQLAKITDFLGNVTTYEYDNLNNLSKTTYPNGFYTTYEYDANHKLIKLENLDKDGNVVTANTLTRNTIGDISSIDRTDYASIDLSNITSTNFTVNESNQITANGADPFTYDENGNLLSYKLAGNQATFTYGLRNKTSSATIGSDSLSYQYDAEGNRVEVTKNGTTTRYVIDNVLGLQKPLVETSTSNAPQKYYIYGKGMTYSVDVSGNIAVYLYDYKGSTTAIVDAEGKVLNSYAYSAYGNILGSVERINNTYKYLGKYGVASDSDNHIYVRARYYIPSLGRWSKLDTLRGGIVNPISLNRYILNKGDIVNYIDISGYLRELIINIEEISISKISEEKKRDRIFTLLGYDPNGLSEYQNAFSNIPAIDVYTLKFGNDVSADSFSTTESIYGYNGRNDESDGFRHAYLNFTMSQLTSIETAKKVGDAHERYTTNQLNETIMDLTNNYIGRKLFERNQGNAMTPEDIVQEAIKLNLVITSPPTIGDIGQGNIKSPPY